MPVSADPSPPVRVLQLLTYLRQSPAGLAFTDLLGCTRIPRATLARLLKDLLAHDYLAKDPVSGHYLLGPALQGLLQPADLRTRLELHAPAVLQALAADTGQTAALFLREGLELVCLCKAVHPDSLAMQELGQRSADYSRSPWGWLLWTGLTAAERAELQALQEAPDLLAPANLTSPRATLGGPARLPRRYALDDGLVLRQTRRLAALLLPPDASYGAGARACIGMAGLSHSLPDDRLRLHIVPRLLQAADTLFAYTAHTPTPPDRP